MPDKFYDKFLNDGENLFRRKTYQLLRENEAATIVTYENLAGTPKGPVIAMPDDHSFSTLRTKEQFIGDGNTEEEALKKCLEKIQNFSFDDFYEKVDDSLPEGESIQ